MGREPGQHGGTITMLMGSGKDVRIMVYYGYARLLVMTATTGCSQISC